MPSVPMTPIRRAPVAMAALAPGSTTPTTGTLDAAVTASRA